MTGEESSFVNATIVQDETVVRDEAIPTAGEH